MVPSPPAEKVALPSIWSIDLRPRHVIVALVLVALAIGLNRFIQMAFRRAVERQRQRGTLTPEIATQLALTRGVLSFAIWAVAVSMALAQFPELRVLSTGLLASAGVSGIIVGFAAQGTLGNAIAGVTISLAQPIRLGDDVELKGERGIVEDIHFIFTVVKLGDGRRMIIPNSVVANEVIRNATMGGVTRVTRVDALVPAGGPVEAVRLAMIEAAKTYERLDAKADAPEVYFVRVDERGTLLRLVATCTDPAAADKLGQKALKRASEIAFRRALGG